MSHEQTIRVVRDTLCAVFAQTDAWFDRPEELRRFKPAKGGWSVDQVLEHVTLTNRFLMLTLGKWVGIAEQRARRGESVPPGESDLERLLVIGERGSFGWVRPEHMEPTGVPSSAEVRATLHQQLGACLIQLERIGGGVGALCRVTMAVNALGKIDLYQWLFFLAQHARRHLQQLAAVESEFAAVGEGRPNQALHLTGAAGRLSGVHSSPAAPAAGAGSFGGGRAFHEGLRGLGGARDRGRGRALRSDEELTPTEAVGSSSARRASTGRSGRAASQSAKSSEGPRPGSSTSFTVAGVDRLTSVRATGGVRAWPAASSGSSHTDRPASGLQLVLRAA